VGSSRGGCTFSDDVVAVYAAAPWLRGVLVPLSLFVAGCGGTGGSSGKKSELTAEQKQKMQEQMQESMAKMKGMQGGTPGEAAKK
jgi:hypothetical protein